MRAVWKNAIDVRDLWFAISEEFNVALKYLIIFNFYNYKN